MSKVGKDVRQWEVWLEAGAGRERKGRVRVRVRLACGVPAALHRLFRDTLERASEGKGNKSGKKG